MSAVVDFPVKPEARPISTRFARDARRAGLARARAGSRPRPASPSWVFRPAAARAGAISICSRSSERRCCRRAAPPRRRAALRERAAALAVAGAAPRLVLVDGRFAAELSRLATARRGLVRRDRRRRSRERPDLVATAVDGTIGRGGAAFRRAQRRVFRRRLCARRRARRRARRADRDHSSGVGQPATPRCTPAASSRSATAAARRIIETYAGERPLLAQRRRRRRGSPPAPCCTAPCWSRRRRRRCISAQLDATLGADARFAGFALLLGGRRVRHEVSVAHRRRGRARAGSTAPFSSRQRGGEHRHTVDHAAPRRRRPAN